MKKTSFLIFFLSVCATTSGSRLLDNGYYKNTPSVYLVSGTASVHGGFTCFQPFTINDPAWQIESIGVFAYDWYGTSGISMGMTGTLWPDINDRPDENYPLANIFYLPPIWDERDWVDVQLDITLPQGRYWIQFAPATSNTVYCIFPGLQGEDDGFGRRASDGHEFVHPASSLRIDGQVIPEPTTLLLFGLGGLGLIRKRRTK